MSEKGFKDYIEKRTVAQIMEDYGEQRDEWQVLQVVQNGKSVDCQHCQQEEDEFFDDTAKAPPFHAEVVDMVCGTEMSPEAGHGYWLPKTVRYFLLKFKTDEGEILEIPVEEEIYLGFDVGLTGTLTLVDGQIYSFEPDAEQQ